MSPAAAAIGGQHRSATSVSQSGLLGECEGSPDPRLWSESEIGRWLIARGLPPEIPNAFEVHLVNGLMAEDLSDADLDSMGIRDPMHQRRVALELRQLFALCSGGVSVGLGATSAPASILASKASLGLQTPSCPDGPRPLTSHRRPRPQSARCQGSSPKPSPYINAMPMSRRPRPRSATTASRAARLGATQPCTAVPASPSLPAARPMPKPMAPLDGAPVSEPQSPAASPRPLIATTAPLPPQRPAATATPLQPPRMPMGPRTGSPSYERDARLGLRAVRASQKRLGCEQATRTPHQEQQPPAVTPATPSAPSTPSSPFATQPPLAPAPENAPAEPAPLAAPAVSLPSVARVALPPAAPSRAHTPTKPESREQSWDTLTAELEAERRRAQEVRESLTAELEAERRRAQDFERLWQRAEQELQTLKSSLSVVQKLTAEEPAPIAARTFGSNGAHAEPQALVLQQSTAEEPAPIAATTLGSNGAQPDPQGATFSAAVAPPDAAISRHNSHSSLRPAASDVELSTSTALPVAANTPPSHRASKGLSSSIPAMSNGTDQLNDLCREFRLQVRDLFAQPSQSPSMEVRLFGPPFVTEESPALGETPSVQGSPKPLVGESIEEDSLDMAEVEVAIANIAAAVVQAADAREICSNNVEEQTP